MLKYEEKKCAYCANMFECKPGNITHCDCYAIEMTAAERQFIATQHDDCLCRDCILAFKSAYAALPPYYTENRLLVFTAKYHLERGYCCRNGCRHCPYKSTAKKSSTPSSLPTLHE